MASMLAAQADTTWTGLGANGNWNDPLNWSNGVPLNSITSNAVTMSGYFQLNSVVNISPLSITSLTFGGNAGAFTLSGNDLTIQSGITNSSPYKVETIQNNIVVGANQTWANSSIAPATTVIVPTQLMRPVDTLIVGTSTSTVTIGTSITLTITGTGTNSALTPNQTSALGSTRIDGQLTGAGNLTITSGDTTLTNTSNNLSGTLTLNGGTLIANNIAALNGAGTGAVLVSSGSNLVYTGNDSPAPTFSRAITLNADFGVTNAGTVTLTFTGGFTGTSRVLNVRGPGNITIGTTGINVGTGGSLDKRDPGTLTINAASTIGNISVRGGTVAITEAVTQGGASNVYVGWYGNNNTAPNTSSPTITMANTNAVLSLSGNGTLSNTSGVYNLMGGSTFILDNSTTNNADRVGTGAIQMHGATYSFIGRNDGVTNSTEAAGAITLAGNYDATSALTLSSVFGGNGNVIKVDRNGAASATLTFASLTRSTAGNNLGTTMDFQGTENLGTTSKVILTAQGNTAFLGAWATATNTATNSTDFAEYDTTAGVRALTSARASAFANNTTDNVLTTADALLSGTSGSNSAKLGGNLDVNGQVLTLNSGGLIAKTGTSSINDTAAIAGSGIKSVGTELFLYTPGGATTTLNAKVLEGAAGSVFTKTGAGILIYNATGSTYTGATIVNGGTMKLGANNVLPSANALIVNDTATFDLNNFDANVGDLLGHGTVLLSAGHVLTVTNNTGNSTTSKTAEFTGILSGTGSLTLNGTGTVGLAGNSPNFTGTINLNKGQLQIDGNLIGDVFGQGTVNLGLDSNAVVLESRASNTPTLFSSLATINIKGADVQIGPSLGNTGRAYILNGPVTFDKGANATQTFRPGTTGGVLFNGLVTVKNDVTFAAGTVTSPVLTFNKGIVLTANSKFTNTLATTMTIQGDGFSGAGFNLTLAGANGYTLNTINGTNTQRFVVGDGTSNGTVTFGSAASTFDGGVTLTSGTIVARQTGTGVSGASPQVTTGPLGIGLAKFTAGSGQLNIGGATLYNAMEFTGNYTFDDNGNTNGENLFGTTSFKGASPLTITFVDNNSDHVVTNAVLYQDATFASTTGTVRIGIGNDGTNRAVAFTGAGAKFVQGYTSGAGTTTFTSGNFTLGSLGGTGGTYIFNGPDITASTNTGTFSNGVKLQAGTLTISNSSVGANVSGPLGTGAVELAGGTIKSDNLNTGRFLANALNITNSFTIGDGGNGGAALNFTNGGSISNSPTITDNSTNGVFVLSGGTTLTSGFTLTGAGGFTLSGVTLPGNRTLTLNSSGAFNLQGALSGAYTLELVGTNQNVNLGSLTGSGTNIRINDAALKVFAGSTSATFSGGVTLAAGTLQLNASSIVSPASGPLGTGTLSLQGGTITTSSGLSPSVANLVALSGSGTTIVQSVNDQNVSFTGGLNVASGANYTLNLSGNGTRNFSGTSTLSGDLTVSGNALNNFSGQFTVNGARTITGTNTNGATFSGGFTGNGSLNFAGTTTRITGGTSDYTGGTTIGAGALLQARTTNNVLSANSVYNVGGTLDLYGNGASPATVLIETIGGLTGSGTVTNSNATKFAAGSKLVFANSGTSDFGGSIDNSHLLAVEMNGTGTQILSGANTYTGGTTVTSGKLVVNGSISGATTVSAGGTLGGSGTVGTVNNSGIVSPGNSPGILSTGNYTQTSSGSLAIELGKAPARSGSDPLAGTDYDRLNVAGTVSLDGNLQLTISAGIEPNDLYFIIANDGSDLVTGTFATINGASFTPSSFTISGQTFAISYTGNLATNSFTVVGGNDVVLQAIPEPSTWAMMIGGFGMLVAFQRRRARKA